MVATEKGYWMAGEINKVPNDAIMGIKDFGWGKTKVTFDKIVELADLEVSYGELAFGKPVVCTVSNTQGAWTGEGAFPLHAMARAVARFVRETKFDKKKVGQ